MATVTAKAHKSFGRGFSNEVQFMKLTYNFADDAGAFADVVKVGTVQGKILVKNAIVHVETACTSAGAAVVTAGAATADPDGFLAAGNGAVASLADDYTVQETASIGLVVDANDTIVVDIATADLTAGKINVLLWYVNID